MPLTTSKIVTQSDALLERCTTVVKRLKEVHADFADYGIDSFYEDDPYVLEANNLPAICIYFDNFSNVPHGVGKTAHIPLDLVLAVKVIWSRLDDNFDMRKLTGSTFILYNWIIDNMQDLVDRISSGKRPVVGPCNFVKERKIVNGTVDYLDAGIFSITYNISKRVTHIRNL